MPLPITGELVLAGITVKIGPGKNPHPRVAVAVHLFSANGVIEEYGQDAATMSEALIRLAELFQQIARDQPSPRDKSKDN